MLVRSSSLSGIHQYHSDSDDKPRKEESKSRRQKHEVKERKAHNQTTEVGWSWLLSPSPRHNLRPHISERSAFPLRRTPALTRFLLKLHEHFTDYCKFLSDPSIENVVKACTNWDASMIHVTSSSPNLSPSSSSTQNLTISSGNATSEIMAWLSSRSVLKSPKPGLMKRSRTDSATSMVDLEGEWDKYVAPLLLLAGAEALFSEMQHIREKKMVKRMIWLYERVSGDLIVLKESLCDSFLLTASKESTTGEPSNSQSNNTSSNQQETQAAASLTASLHALVAITRARCQMIQTQSNVFTHSEAEQPSSLVWMDIARTYEELVLSLPEIQESGLAAPLIDSVRKETTAWMLLMRLVQHVERCKFTETLITAKRLKGCLNLSSQAGFQVWFRSTVEDILSVLPLIFDRIDAFATPRYGFDKGLLLESAWKQKDRLGGSFDFESAVLDLLRRHEKAGGFAMAVAIVLNAAETSNLHIERGYSVDDDIRTSLNNVTQFEADRLEWPPVFMRTTIHLGAAMGALGRSPSGSGGVFGNIRRSGSLRSSGQFLLRAGSRRELEADPSKQTQSRSCEPSLLVSSPKHKQRKTFPVSPGGRQRTLSSASLPTFNVLEYEPDSGEPGWPYSDWPTLLSLVRPPQTDTDAVQLQESNSKSLIQEEAFTYRRAERITSPAGVDPTEDAQDEDGTFASVFGLPSLWSAPTSNTSTVASDHSSPPTSLSRSSSAIATCFHLARVSEFMWLVIMVKEGYEEESRWTRRRSRGLADDEILSFLNDLASKLRMESLFQVQTTTRLLNRKQPQHLPTGFSLAHALEQATIHWDAQEFLRFLRESFGLRTQHHFGEGWRSPFSGRRNGQAAAVDQSLPEEEPSLLVSLPGMINDEHAAANFFLGSELGRLLG